MIDRAPPAPDLKPPFPQPHEMPALQTTHLFAEGAFAAFDPEGVKQEPPRDIDIHRRRNQTALHKCTLLGCEDKTLWRNRIEKRFDAEAVPREKQILGLYVEDRQCPHSVETRQHLFPPRLPRCKDDFSI